MIASVGSIPSPSVMLVGSLVEIKNKDHDIRPIWIHDLGLVVSISSDFITILVCRSNNTELVGSKITYYSPFYQFEMVVMCGGH